MRTRPSLLLAFVATACAAPPPDVPADSATSAVLDAALFKPVAAWTGRLVLPCDAGASSCALSPRATRRADGAVRFEVRNTPNPAFAGKTVWVKPGVEWAAEVTADVAFSRAANDSVAKGNIHPTRLDGWARVSPLESLAGARPVDDVEVALEGVAVDGDELVATREPTQIAGDKLAYVQIGAPVVGGAPGERAVRHFEARTKSFDASGKSDRFIFDAPVRNVAGVPLSPIESIERTEDPVGRAGYYAYGRIMHDGRFHVLALQPEVTRKIPSVNVVHGASGTKNYVVHSAWEDTEHQKGKVKATLLVPDGVSGDDATRAWSDDALREGTELLVMHVFGAIGPAESANRTGHFAFGTAKVVKSAFTGEPELDVRYRQIYAHNPNGIVAGTHAWASYQGSFARGWMYARPISDVVLALPFLTRSYDLGGTQQFRPIDGLVRELDAMAARYRIGLDEHGHGTGAAVVTPANSCVQDSSQALFFALAKLQDDVESNAQTKAFVAANPGDAEVADYQRLRALSRTVEGYLSPLGITRGDWKSNYGHVAGVSGCPGGLFGAIVCGLASYRTIFPRSAGDAFATALLDAGAGGVSIRASQIGGAMPGITPLAPLAPLD